MRMRCSFAFGLGIVLTGFIGLSGGPIPCFAGENVHDRKPAILSMSHEKNLANSKWNSSVSKTQKATTGTIVGRIPVAVVPKKILFSAISDAFQLKPETDVYLYSPTISGERQLLATVKPDHHGMFKFTNVPPSDNYKVVAKHGLGVKKFRGEREGISVSASKTNDIGNVELSQ